MPDSDRRQIKPRSQRTRVRRLKSESSVVAADVTTRLTALGTDINRQHRIIEKAQTALAQHQTEAEVLLIEHKLDEFVVEGEGTHQMHKAKANDKTDLDVKAFRKLVGDKEFIAIASVTQKAAQEMVTGKQWAKITTKTVGGMKDAVYRFLQPGKKK